MKRILQYTDFTIEIETTHNLDILEHYDKSSSPMKIKFIPIGKIKEHNFNSFIKTENLINDIKEKRDELALQYNDFYKNFEFDELQFLLPTRCNIRTNHETGDVIVGCTEMHINCHPKESYSKELEINN